MENKKRYLIGEYVVNRDKLLSGKVCSIKGNLVEVCYSDGTKEWISEDKVTKLLLETDPNTTNLNEEWNV